MAARKITLEESIARLARETGASESFVEKVRALFLGRGIDLEDSSEPYTHALVDAFRRHASLRQQLDDARASLVKLHTNLAEMGESFQGQLGRLRALRDSLERKSADMRRVAIGDGKSLRLVPGEHDRAIVPGPDEIQ
ncbi:MAG TPA: hypothetical protein VFV19_09775 [Candidatus Polarisedimenticolaceae bacterium]|nr:hypothetical protein [Candidatus Polarisedimenticolaceae bacterium]